MQFQRPHRYSGPFKAGRCPSCGSFDAMFQPRRGGRCTDAFRDPATIAAMEAQFLSPDDLYGLPIYNKDGE
jgi:hypothetical protein